MTTLILLFLLFYLFSFFLVSRILHYNYINFYTFYATEYTLKIFLSLLGMYVVDKNFLHDVGVIYVTKLSILYIFFVFIGTVIKPLKIFRRFFKLFYSKHALNKFLSNKFLFGLILFFLGALLFLLLMYQSGAGYLWLTNSRFAYQNYREGVGYLYVLSQFMFYLSFILLMYCLDKKSHVILRIIFLFLFFSFILYFFGSKRSILTLLVIVVVYYNYYISRISLNYLFIIFIAIILAFLLLQFLYSSYDALTSLFYFNYYNSMIIFVEKVGTDFFYGSATLSSLWMFVPRAIYDDKPYVYAAAYVTDFVSPGSAEKGHFLGTLPWSVSYLDFGLFGLILSAIITGIFLRNIHHYFVINKHNIFLFIGFTNLCFSPMLKHVPSFSIYLFIILMIIFFRFKFK